MTLLNETKSPYQEANNILHASTPEMRIFLEFINLNIMQNKLIYVGKILFHQET